MKKIISVMAVWDEQNMISLSIESTKDIVYEYIIIIKKGIDKTEEIINFIKDKWNLKIQIIHSELKLRFARKLAFELTKEYADYYLIQDGDEIYFTTDELKEMNRKTIIDLIEEDYDHCETSMIYLKHSLTHTQNNLTWLIPHPFLIKNLPEIFWPDKGDLPYLKYNWNIREYKLYNTGEKKNPFKFDCNIKNFRRLFLRQIFTEWHDSEYNNSIDEFAWKFHPDCIWYKQNINENSSLDEIISYFETNSDKYKFCKLYCEDEYYAYPKIIKKYINQNLIFGIDDIEKINLI